MSKQNLHIFFTTDIHGNYFCGDLRPHHKGRGGLPSVHALVAETVASGTESVLLIDGGDLLEGDLPAFCLNYLAPAKERGVDVARMMDYIGYDAAVVGNHDIEAGIDVVRQFAEHCGFTVLAANILAESTDRPAFAPYESYVRGGWKVAVLGLCTDAVPVWVPSDKREGLRFQDMVECARQWIPVIRERVKPDVLVCVMHSGLEGGVEDGTCHENDVRRVVENVEGIDVVLYGHDHHPHFQNYTNPAGQTVRCINPGCAAHNIADVLVREEEDGQTHISARNRNISKLRNGFSMSYTVNFRKEYQAMKATASRVVGHLQGDIHVPEAFFGPSAYVDFMQRVMLEASGAELAFASPLYLNGHVAAGDVNLIDLSCLYHLDDRLFVMRMSGEEIRRYLEKSYAAWVGGMSSPDDPLFLLTCIDAQTRRMVFKNYVFNFDSAAGIRYTVNVDRPVGERIEIQGMADGTPFQPERTYTVCMTGYRASGGGELLTRGAGIARSELPGRLVRRLDGNVADALIAYFRDHPDASPDPMHLWSFEPQEWTLPAMSWEWERLKF